MAENEEKGFVIKDRRKLSSEEETETRGKIGKEEELRTQHQYEKTSQDEHGSVPLPEVSLSTFVFSLSSSALVHLGEIPEPDTQRVQMDLPMAKQIIDTLGMLQDKTKGNLDPDEDRLLRSVLYDLRMRYVQKSAK